MIIFFTIFLFIIFILFVKIKVNIKIRLENTISYIEIKTLWIDFNKKGKFVLNKKIKENKLNYAVDKNDVKNKKIKNSESKNKTSKRILSWFFKNIRYDEVIIFEKVGVLNPFITSMTLPVVSLITTIPLNLFKINYNKFKYEIIPDYNNFILQFRLDAKASFRIISLIKCIIKEKVAKNRC